MCCWGLYWRLKVQVIPSYYLIYTRTIKKSMCNYLNQRLNFKCSPLTVKWSNFQHKFYGSVAFYIFASLVYKPTVISFLYFIRYCCYCQRCRRWNGSLWPLLIFKLFIFINLISLKQRIFIDIWIIYQNCRAISYHLIVSARRSYCYTNT